ASVIRSELQQQETTTLSPTTEAAPTTPRESELSTESADVELASVDPAPGTVDGDLSVSRDKLQQKSARLLLLSTPAKRPAEVEQQLVEQDESETAAAGSAEAGGATALEADTTDTTTTEYSETTTETATATAVTETTTTEPSERKTTKLFAINATISSQDSTEPNVAVALATDNATVAIAEQPQAAGDNNAAIELALVEPEAEYVLHDDHGSLQLHLELEPVPELGHELLGYPFPGTGPTHDDLQLGSFTHIDSDVHLQPVVHSVEIVPTRIDDPLIVNYVHNLR
ncbi:hypothetical protein KR222_009812, partial [Zaprionus bogoriensis]